MSDERTSQTPIMVVLSMVILVLAARLLYLVDQSLREGEGMGLSGDGAIETIPILILLGLLIWMSTRPQLGSKLDTDSNDTQAIGIMLGMFLLGIYIGPGLTFSLDSELIGLAFLVVPILLIAAILLPGNTDPLVSIDEEE